MSDAPVELTIVVPTFKERDNVAPLLERLERILAGIEWQVVFVDDDLPDGTADTVRAVAQRDRRVRVIQRIGRRGLSSACVEGILSSSSPFVAVIDADLQHDETLLPAMLKRVKADALDLAVASRYAEGGSTVGWDWRRQWISRLAVYVAQFLFKVGLQGPDERLFPHSARSVRRRGAPAFATGVQDPVRHHGVVAAAAEIRRAALPVR